MFWVDSLATLAPVGRIAMSKPTLVSDVRSVLRRSLPEIDPRVIEFDSAQYLDIQDDYSPVPESPILRRAREVMNSLQAASALSRLFPGMPLLLVAFPEDLREEPKQVAPLTLRDVTPRPERIADLAAIIRSSFVDEFEAGVPAAAEALLGELGVIERQDHAYYLDDSPNEDSIAAYNYRQCRRKDILAELLELKR